MATNEERRAQHRHKHKQRVIRGTPDELWDDLDTTTKTAGTDRSAVTREFWEWYVQRPGAKLPQRPAPECDCLATRLGYDLPLNEHAEGCPLRERPVSGEETSG